MMVRSRALAVCSIVWLALSGIGAAHHGQLGLFDQNKVIEVKGSVKEWNFVNPHPILVLEVVDQGTTTPWDVYFGPAAVSFMKRQGYARDTFKVGEPLVVKGHPATGAGARGLDVFGSGTGVTRPDGTRVPQPPQQ
jgi:hypothetical protein